tara:strand:- start:2141 stop:2425 length:285 start_codon:yes stop_codon:yes gene_type:complete
MNHAEYEDYINMSEEIERKGNAISSQNLLIKELEKKISKLEKIKKDNNFLDKLNENLVMIAYQLYISNHKGMEEYATIKNFLADLKNIQKEGQE